MKIENVRWIDNQGYWRDLHLTLDGTPAILTDEQKATLVEHGILYVLPDDVWGEKLSKIILPADPEAGRSQHELTSCIQDESVFRLWREMVDASQEEFQARATYSTGESP